MFANPTKEMGSATPKQDDLLSAGDWLYWKCEYDKAREHFQAVLKQASLSASDSARCYKSMGAVEVELKNYDEALNIYNKQLGIMMASDSPSTKEDIISCYLSIGKVYWLKLDYNQAIAYHHRALEFARASELSSSHISTVHKNLANIYTNAKKFDLALEHFQKGLEIDHQHLRQDHPQFGQTYANMGMMYQSKQHYKEALDYLEKARETWLKTFPSTHVSIEKLEKTIRKVKSKLVVLPWKNTFGNLVLESLFLKQPVNPFDILARSNIMVIWLDEYIGRDENCRALKMEFRQITNNLKMVDSVDSCRQCLPHVKNRKLFFIIQGKYAKEIVPDIVEIVSSSMKPVVYVFCLHMIYFIEWAQEQECVMEGGIFDHEKDLLSRLTKDLNDYVKQKSIEYKHYFQPEQISKFLAEFTQIFERCCRARDAIASSHEAETITAQ
ncbi:unnamed protein product [Rotaria sp. Silwood2]|nr:unnamed protein product [Rotaria sp. Silwood2]